MPKLQAGGVVAAAFLAVVFVLQVAALPVPNSLLIAHEWGTFTALQDDDGAALGAINADDEPVPVFVRQARYGTAGAVSARSQLTPRLNSKGLWPCHPGVTMRLETPVIYFYPPENQRIMPVNVRVTFRGGWLTEFYPAAKVDAPDLTDAQTSYPPLTATTSGGLAWEGVELSASGDLMVTRDPVWTAPREVERAAFVKVPRSPEKEDGSNNYSEKFLFYRGVGRLNSPLRAVRDRHTDRLNLYADHSALNPRWRGATASDLHVPAAWLIEIRPQDGLCAFRPVSGVLDLGAPANQPLTALPANFTPNDFSANRLSELRGAMKEALVAAGLFPDEAAAMLKTWELSYFKSPGRRLFYITPRDWVDQVLPLAIDGAQINRAMMGRIELITPAQREALARIAAGPCPDMAEFMKAYYEKADVYYREVNRRMAANDPTLHWGEDFVPSLTEDVKVDVPEVYQAYLRLGRFRDALVLNEQQVRPTSALAAFIAGNELQAKVAP